MKLKEKFYAREDGDPIYNEDDFLDGVSDNDDGEIVYELTVTAKKRIVILKEPQLINAK
jgi:hypothetical protein